MFQPNEAFVPGGANADELVAALMTDEGSAVENAWHFEQERFWICGRIVA